jgi:hypothetical protein
MSWIVQKVPSSSSSSLSSLASAILSSGLDTDELLLLKEVIFDECQELGISYDDTNLISMASPVVSIPGAMGRVLLFRFDSGMDDDPQQQQDNLLEDLEGCICERIDQLLCSGNDDDDEDDDGYSTTTTTTTTTPTLKEAVLVCFQTEDILKQSQLFVANDENSNDHLSAVVEEHIQRYEMLSPLQIIPPTIDDANNNKNKDTAKSMTYVPSIHVEIDGGYVSYHPPSMPSLDTTSITTTTTEKDDEEEEEEEIWDASTLLVFDNLVDKNLRKRLLDVVIGEDSDNHDPRDGPNPDRWVRGGLLDHNNDPEPDEEDEESSSSAVGWGLTDAGLENICFDRHDAVQEMESILANLFRDFLITRLPETILGSSVTPMTANAPTAGDVFDYHIDADPNVTPSSPWTDVYGRYPNRSRGKPRFMSCLIYLNEEWDGNLWGAPTRFVDVPTDEDLNVYDVSPRPGRCIIMDQDIGHTVVAPNAAAGKQPRYSLVWKLILHPRFIGQDMKHLSGGRETLWPETEYFGSAAQNQDTHS